MSLYIGVDSGTQSVKAIALDMDTGRVVAEARAPHHLIEGLPPGHMEAHPEEWVAAMDAAVGEVASRIDRSRVRGIGVSGQQHGFVALDKAGAVIRPAKLWCDTSTAAECAILTRKLGGRASVIRKTGLPFLPGYTAPKVLWLRRHEPANFKRLRHILLPHDYLNFHLTGRYFMEFGDASGTGFLDVRRRAWSEAAMDAVDGRVAECLPPPSAVARGVRHASARDRGALRISFGDDRERGRGRQHDGRHRDRKRGPRGGHGELRNERHDLRLLKEAGRRSHRGDRGILLVDRRLAAASVHDERHRRHRAGEGPLWLEPGGPGTGRGLGACRIGRSDAPSLPGRRAYPQPPEGHRGLLRPRSQDARAGAPRPRRDRGDDARHELRPPQALRPRREAEGDPAHGGRGPLGGMAPGRRRCLWSARGRDGAGRERGARRGPAGRLVRLEGPRPGRGALGALQPERLPRRVDPLRPGQGRGWRSIGSARSSTTGSARTCAAPSTRAEPAAAALAPCVSAIRSTRPTRR